MATLDAIRKLHTSMIDTGRAYEKAREKTDEDELKALFGGMADLRGRAHAELHHVLIDMGETPDDDGSFMTTVHETVISVRSAIKGIGRDALSAFVDGEQTIVKEYDDALGQHDVHAKTSDLLNRQKAELIEMLQRMKALAG